MHIILDILLLLATLVYSYIEAFVMLFVLVSPKDIRGKLVLVTGGGRGIGRCLALRFSQEGAKLAIRDIDKTLKEFLPVMMTHDSGHVVTIASIAATRGTASATDYCASKWAVYGLTEALSVELREKGKSGVKTTIICPALTNTRLVSDLSHRIVLRVPRFGKVLTPEYVAEAAVRGVLVDKPVVYVPDRLNSTRFLNHRTLTPKRFQMALSPFYETGFMKKE